MKISLIISVYKDAENLEVILEALRYQTYRDFEIVVSEDGDYPVMKKFLAGYRHPNPIVHLTQPDVGWRKNQALNNAIRKSSGAYLVFIDGDCVPHHRFLEHHFRFSGHNTIVAGRRVKLGPKYTQIFKENIQDLMKLEKRVMLDYFGMKKDKARFY